MRIPEIAIKNFRFTILMMFLLITLGLFSFLTMPRYEDPQFGAPGLVILLIYPGASPEDVESQIIKPIEERLKEVQDLERVLSFSYEGLASLAFKYEYGIDHDEKYNELVREINSIRDELPEGLSKIEFLPIETESVNIYQWALVSEEASFESLEKHAESFIKKVEKVEGIRQADLHAMPEREVHINVELDKLALLNIPLRQVAGAVQSANEVIPSGNIEVSNKNYSVKSNSKYENLDNIKSTVVHGSGGKIVMLKDIADVTFDYNDAGYKGRYNGERCLFITAQQKVGSSIKTISNNVESIFNQTSDELPSNIKLVKIFEQSESVQERTYIFFTNLLQGVLLVGLIIGIIVGFRASIIIMLAVPVSLIIGIGMVDMGDFGLQQMTIAGLIIALGLLVDNAIVVTENVVRFLELGYSPRDAAIKGAKQVGWPVISSTATTILAFLPMTNIQDPSGDFIKSLPLTVIFTITASLLVALALTPFITTKLFNEKTFAKKNRLQLGLDHFINNQYLRALNFVLRNKTITLIFAAALFAASLYTFQEVGLSFFPKAEKPILLVDIDAPYGSNLDYADSVSRKVEDVLKQQDLISHYATNLGRGNPKIYYNHFPKRNASRHAQIFVGLKKYEAEEVNKLVIKLRNEFDHYAGVKIGVKELEQGPPTDNPIAFRINGEDKEVLATIADDIEQMFEQTSGLRDIDNIAKSTITSLNVNINKPKAGMLGVSMSDINQTLRVAVDGAEITKFNDSNGDQFPIKLQLKGSDELSFELFNELYVSSLSGAQIPLSQVAKIEFKTSPFVIRHFRFDRSTSVTAAAEEGYNINELTNQLIRKLEAYEWPEGYNYVVAGEKEKLGQSLQGIGIAAMIAIIGIFSVLVLQFRSFTQPLIIFSALPFAVIGSVFTLYIIGLNFSFTAFVGLTSLIGIVVNDSIILIDFANQSRREGKDKLTAITEAGTIRFIPIILTTLTTVGGLLPLTLRGGTLWAPMGWTIIGGLLVATFLILFIVPVLYMIYSEK